MTDRFLGYTDESAAAADLTQYPRITAPATVGKLPMFSGVGPVRVSDSVYRQADNGHQVIVGSGATVNAAQVVTKPCIVIGEGSTAWGDGAIAIGKTVTAGQAAAKDGCIVIGNGSASNGKNAVRIGSELAFGVGAGDDAIAIGTQALTNTSGISIGRGVHCGIDCVAIGTLANAGVSTSIAIGKQAVCSNTNGIAIGTGAQTNTNNGQSAIAIGTGAIASHVLGQRLIAIGEAALINTNLSNTIVIGYQATSTRSNEVVFGSANGPITLFTVQPGAGTAVRHRAGNSGEWMVRSAADLLDLFVVEQSGTADDIDMKVFDVTANTLKRVTRGAVDSGGAGFRLLRIPN